MNDSAALGLIVEPLLSWYAKNARILPWRSDPTPYHVWLSEIMLQQTRVEAVKEYYLRFLAAVPNIDALAQLPEQQLLKLWEGLGYYNRARNLQKAAKQIVAEYHGELPADYQLLQKLPGIGSYTAGAIGSIAFGLPVPAVDGNVLRVLSRVLARTDNISRPETKANYEAMLLKLLPTIAQKHHTGNFTQALMELGATVCIPNGSPKCLLCPLETVCKANLQKIAEQLPVKDEKKSRSIVCKTVFLLQCEDRIAIQKRPETGLLASLWELPNLDQTLLKKEVFPLLQSWNLLPLQIKSMGKAKHIFTHIEWRMTGFSIKISEIPVDSPFLWVTSQQLKERYPLPNAFSKFLRDFPKK